MNRCDWCVHSQIEIDYHDNEWGVPLYDDRKLFEFLILDTFQAGLSWRTILNKRENFRQAFDSFNPIIIAKYSNDKFFELMNDNGIIRNKMKIEAAIINSQKFIEIKEKYSSFSNYIWSFSDGQIILNSNVKMKDVSTKNIISDKMSSDMKKFGFKFVGTTICYAFMQAMGMVNDHLLDCYRYPELINNY